MVSHHRKLFASRTLSDFLQKATCVPHTPPIRPNNVIDRLVHAKEHQLGQIGISGATAVHNILILLFIRFSAKPYSLESDSSLFPSHLAYTL